MKSKGYFHSEVYVMHCVVDDDKMVDVVDKRIQYGLAMRSKVEAVVQTLGYYYLLLMMRYCLVLHCDHTMSDCCFEQKAPPCTLVLLQHPFQPSL